MKFLPVRGGSVEVSVSQRTGRVSPERGQFSPGGRLSKLLVILTHFFVLAPHAGESVQKKSEKLPPPFPEFPDLPDEPEGGGGGAASMSSGSATWDGNLSSAFRRGERATRVAFRPAFPSAFRPFAVSSPRSPWSTALPGSGVAGVGWNVSGFSDVERRSVSGGWPKFDSTDTYWLDGKKLVPCGTIASPGCDSGGTHFTEAENYFRIVQDGTDSWTLTSRNGVGSIYSVMGFTGTRKFCWFPSEGFSLQKWQVPGGPE